MSDPEMNVIKDRRIKELERQIEVSASRIHDLQPMLEALEAGVISTGRAREIIEEWLHGWDYELPDDDALAHEPVLPDEEEQQP